ncbi:MAG: DUF6298 domain-containing protein [Caldilineaceae bacterium]
MMNNLSPRLSAYPNKSATHRRKRRTVSAPVVASVMVFAAILMITVIGLWPQPFVRIVNKVSTLLTEQAYSNGALAETKAKAAATAIHQSHQTRQTDQSTPMSTPNAAAVQVINGPLHVATTNPRYFADADGNIVYLTGSHTWSNFQDNGGSDPPPVFDYTTYLDFLETNNHNFFRLWTWEESRWTTETGDDDYWFNPGPPYLRTGPGMAVDGKPKFDLSQFDQSYFDRMRARVIEAQARGFYVAIVLFNGWSVSASKGWFDANNPWQGHPFNPTNNINDINGDPNGDNSGEEIHTLAIPAITALQEDYVRKVVDTVNDLDNVLYEISNESNNGSEAWQYHMIDLIHSYEATKAEQHPVGMTVEWPDGDNEALYASPADWISPNGEISFPEVADGRKVILLDTDHLCGVCGDRGWVWKAFTRGHNPIFMDGYDGAGYGVGGAGFNFDDGVWVTLRRNLGYSRAYANRMDLAAMTPHGELASSGYCLASPTAHYPEYLVYLPNSGTVTVDLSDSTGEFTVEWFDPKTGETTTGANVTGGRQQRVTAPFDTDAVLYIYTTAKRAATTTVMVTATITPTQSVTATAVATGQQPLHSQQH